MVLIIKATLWKNRSVGGVCGASGKCCHNAGVSSFSYNTLGLMCTPSRRLPLPAVSSTTLGQTRLYPMTTPFQHRMPPQATLSQRTRHPVIPQHRHATNLPRLKVPPPPPPPHIHEHPHSESYLLSLNQMNVSTVLDQDDLSIQPTCYCSLSEASLNY